MATRKNPGWSESAGSLGNPFAAALGRDVVPQDAGVPPQTELAATSHATVVPARAVLRLERKGRGGKLATCVTHLALPTPQLEALCAKLRQALGCGGAVEQEVLVLQGDQRDRAAAWLTTYGVKRVTLG